MGESLFVRLGPLEGRELLLPPDEAVGSLVRLSAAVLHHCVAIAIRACNLLVVLALLVSVSVRE